MIGINSCLDGICCHCGRKSQEQGALKRLATNEKVMMICSEVSEELPIPHPSAEIIDGDGFDVWTNTAYMYMGNEEDMTETSKAGVQRAYQELKALRITAPILKEKSLSCDSQPIHGGQFSDIRKVGVGVATAYFIQ